MPKIVKKESGERDVIQPERGDPRQHVQPIDKAKVPADVGPAQDRAPEGSPRTEDSPWMGGG